MYQLEVRLRCVGYIRVSTNNQGDKGFSIEQQIADIERYCQTNNLELVAQFKEIESGGTLSNRPIMQEVVWRVCEEDLADVILVTNLDRATRSISDYQRLSRILRQKGKRLIFTQQSYLTPLQSDPDDEVEDFLWQARQTEVLRAEGEKRIIRRRSIKGRQRKFEVGGWIGHRPPYGYQALRGKLYEDPEQQFVLRLIRRLTNWVEPSNYWIARYLDGDNGLLNPDGTRGRAFPPPSAKPPVRDRRRPLTKQLTGKWSQGTVWRIVNWPDRYVADPPRFRGTIIRMV